MTASDGDLEDSRVFDLIVESLNKAPVIDIDDVTVDEGDTITLDPDVTDPDGDDVTVEYSGFMTSPTKQTDFDDAGEYTVTITASDGINEASVTITVTVNDVNRAPTFDPGAFI